MQRRRYQDHIKPERPGFIDETWTVIMDDHGSCKATRRFIRIAGVKFIFLSKYSPDLNLIEQMIFVKRKALVAQGAARFVETICAAIARMLADISDECANYF